MFKKNIFTDYGRRIGMNPYIQEVSDEEAIDIDEEKRLSVGMQTYLIMETSYEKSTIN